MGADVKICARCERLKTEGYPDKLKQGQGYCRGHEDDSPSRGPFATWNDRACVLFIRAKDMALRERRIEKWESKPKRSQMQQQQLDANRRLAELMGWTNIFQVSGALLGTPPDGVAQSRGQARVPDWNGDWRDCGPLLERDGITRDAIVANEIARLEVGQ